jgi:uncharacterized protein (TIGR00156 family)
MFKKLIVLPLALVTTMSFAQNSTIQQGGFTGPSSEQTMTVKQALDARDDAVVSITGYIVESNGGEDYWFEDKTGRILVEIDAHLFQNQTVTPKMSVTITGEIDKDWNEVSLDADVLRIN